MKRFFNEETGSVLVLTALAMVALIGFLALAIDGGYSYYRDVRLQDIADASALAGATEMGETTSNSYIKKKESAFNKAVEYAEKNNLTVSSTDTSTYSASIKLNSDSGNMQVSFPDTNLVKVEITIGAKLFYAPVLGYNSVNIKDSATASIQQAAKQTGGLVPVGIVGSTDPTSTSADFIPGTQYEMTLGPSDGFSGNYGWLNFDQSSYFNDYIEKGYDGTLNVGDKVNTKTGVDVGLVANALKDRLQLDIHTYDNYDEKCPRLIYVPIVDKYGDSGTSEVTIIGFAAFFLESYNHDGNNIVLVGRFLEKVKPEDIAPSELGYTTHAVRLVD